MGLTDSARLCDQVKIDYVYDADGTYDGTASMIDMKGWDGCLVLAICAATTPDTTNRIKAFKIVSNTTAAGAGTDHDIAEAVTTDGGTDKALLVADFAGATPVAPTTVNDQMLVLDIKASQMYAGDRYIAAVTTGTGTFTCVFIYIRYNGNFSFKDMFQSTTAGARTAFQHDGDL